MTIVEREILAIALFESSVRCGKGTFGANAEFDWVSLDRLKRNEWRTIATESFLEARTKSVNL